MEKISNKDLPILDDAIHNMKILWASGDKLGIYVVEINESFVITRPKRVEWDDVSTGDKIEFRLTTQRLINNGKPVVYGTLHLDNLIKFVPIKTVPFRSGTLDELEKRVEMLERIASKYYDYEKIPF